MPPIVPKSKVPTPCVGVCSTVYGDLVCRGCKRFTHEITEWNAFTDAEKAAVVARLDILQERIVGARVEVFDKEMLLRQLRAHGVRFNLERGVYHWAGELIRVAGDRLEDLQSCGIWVLPPYDCLTLPQLRDRIEEELLALSDAHLRRYFPDRLPDEAGV